MKPIHIKESHKGRLHAALHVPEGEKIPTEKIDKAVKSESPELRKMANFAKNSAHWSGR